MTLTDAERQYLETAAAHLPPLYAAGGASLADDLRMGLPDLTDVQLCRTALMFSKAVADLIRALAPEEVDAKTIFAFFNGTALELARIERGGEQ